MQRLLIVPFLFLATSLSAQHFADVNDGVRLWYTEGGKGSPVIVIHGNGLDNVPDTYRRYLEGMFRETFSLQGTPLRVEFRSTRNPYESKSRA